MKSPTYKIFTIYDSCLLVCFFGFISFLCISFFSFNENNKAIWYMSQRKYEKAEEVLLKNLNKNTFSLLYRLNLAFNHTLSTQYEKSIQEYQVIKRLIQNSDVNEYKLHLNESTNQSKNETTSQTPQVKELLFYPSFNSAVAATQKGEKNRALSFYQQALSIHPDSVETKINIELLTRNTNNKSQQNQQSTQEHKNKENNSTKQKQQNSSQSTNQQKDQQKNTPNTDGSQSNTEKEEKNQMSEDQKKTSQGITQKNSENTQIFNEQQIETILRSIQDQEKDIRKRRMEGQKQNSRQNPNDTKDW